MTIDKLPLEDEYRIYNCIHPCLWDFAQKCSNSSTLLVDFNVESPDNFSIYIKNLEECCGILKKKYLVTMKNKKKPADKYMEYINDYVSVKTKCTKSELNILIVVTGLHNNIFTIVYNLSYLFLSDVCNYFSEDVEPITEEVNKFWSTTLTDFYKESDIRSITKNMGLEKYSNIYVVLLAGAYDNHNKIYGSIISYEHQINNLKRWMAEPAKIAEFKNIYNNRKDNYVVVCAFSKKCRHYFITRLFDIKSKKKGSSLSTKEIPENNLLTNSTNSKDDKVVSEPTVTEPKVAKPTVTEPKVAKPTVTEPKVAKPTVTEPKVAKPTVTEPKVAKPTVTEPKVAKPTVTEPKVAKPTVTEPKVAKPTVTEPKVAKPTVTEPKVAKPTVTEPIVVESTVSEPTVSEPTVSEPTVSEPIVSEPIVAKPTPKSKPGRKPKSTPIITEPNSNTQPVEPVKRRGRPRKVVA
jgi:hypothetical protein